MPYQEGIWCRVQYSYSTYNTWTAWISLFIIYSTEVEFAILNAMLDANAKKLGSDGFSKLQKC